MTNNPRLHAIRQAWDAGNRHAIREGRAVWTPEDWTVAALEWDRLQPYRPNPFVT